MKTVREVMTRLEKLGREKTRSIYARHGIDIPMFGVSVADLKSVAKTIRGSQALALALFDTGNYDAMYLAGLVADGSQMSKRQIEQWAKATRCEAVCSYVVPWVACESPFARELALTWIDSRQPAIAISGWSTYGGIVATTADKDLHLGEISSLLDRVVRDIRRAPNKVRYVMNSFVIAVGGHVKPLLKQAKQAAKTLGRVPVDMGDTACQVPVALDYIKKMEDMGRIGKKRKTMKC